MRTEVWVVVAQPLGGSRFPVAAFKSRAGGVRRIGRIRKTFGKSVMWQRVTSGAATSWISEHMALTLKPMDLFS